MALIGIGGDTCKAEDGGGTGLGGEHTEEKGVGWCELTKEEEVGDDSLYLEGERVLSCLYYRERVLCIDESI